VKTYAGDSWQYIDPSSLAATTLQRPQRPQPTDFGGTNASNIAADQRQQWLDFNTLYYRELKEYEREKSKIDKAEQYIITHVEKSFLLQRANKSLRDFLIHLKNALAPTEKAREQSVVDTYNRAKQFDSRSEGFDSWHHTYLSAYLQAKETQIPDVSGDRAYWDVIKVIKRLDDGYAAVISIKITSTSANPPSDLPSVEDVLNSFSQHYRRTKIMQPQIHGGVFGATLNQEPSPYIKKRSREDATPHKPCLCGDAHFWGQCPYIDTSLRSTGFIEDPEKVKKIALFETRDHEGILNKIREKNRRFKKQRNKASDKQVESDSIEIDAGDDPTDQLPYQVHALF
jgi:hypothetical protein